MSGVFNMASVLNAVSAAPVREYSGRQMPREMIWFHAQHCKKPARPNGDGQMDKGKTKLRLKKSPQKAASESADSAIGEGEAEDEAPSLRVAKNRIQFTRMMNARTPNDYEDTGSQTDHSDISEGHYSDETTDDRRLRENRNEEKKRKRILRLREINKKHGIVD